ncbi:MAG: cytochrome C, partial [Gammaproteobacteria bacterium]|nr:cytochrome C [Gammaproteobacteria bacterium]
MSTTAQCSVCHTSSNTGNYTTFLGGSYTHSTPPGVCSTCHNGQTALGKSATHVVTTGACSFCHTQTNTSNYTTFLGASFVHASPPGVCSTCHDGNQATGKPVFHIPTTAACDSSGCHSQTNTSNYTTF